MIKIEWADRAAIDYVAHHLRALDLEELTAMSAYDDPVPHLANRVMQNALMSFVAFSDGVPVSVWGMCPLWRGVGSAFAFGTDDWGKALLPMTRNVRGFMMRFLLENGYHRIECRSLASRPDVGRWLRLFDAKAETVLRGSGARGEDFILYRWLRDERRTATKNVSQDRVAARDRRGHRRSGDAVRDVLPRKPLSAVP